MTGLDTIILVLQLLAGFVILFLGRQFWGIFVIVVGFEAGMILSPVLSGTQDDLITLIAGMIGAFVSGMLGLLLQRIGAAISGYGVTSYFALWVLQFFGIHLTPTDGMKWLIVFVLGGAVGMVLIFIKFDYGLIFLSCTAGATLITNELTSLLSLQTPVMLMSFSILFLLGIVVQAMTYVNRSAHPNHM